MTTTTPIDVEAAYEACQAITRREARNFYYAFLTLPKPRRRAIYAAYAFSRLADDIADEPGEPGEKAARLAELRQHLGRAYAGAPEGPILTALAHAASEYDIPEALFSEIIDGVEMDLTQRRYATFEDLRAYCYRVAGVVGLVSLQIFGYSDPKARDYAVDLGLAMQLTNIMRDLKEDAERDRIYLPQDELQRFGYPEGELLGGIINDRFEALMRFQAERAQAYFDSGARLLPLLQRRSRGCASGLHSLYSSLLRRMEARRFDVFSARVSVPIWEKLRLTLTLWLTSTLPLPRRR